MTDDDRAERQFIESVLEGIQTYVETIEAVGPLPGGRKLVFLAAAGCRHPDGTTALRIICNSGTAGMGILIAELEKERQRREADDRRGKEPF